MSLVNIVSISNFMILPAMGPLEDPDLHSRLRIHQRSSQVTCNLRMRSQLSSVNIGKGMFRVVEYSVMKFRVVNPISSAEDLQHPPECSAKDVSWILCVNFLQCLDLLLDFAQDVKRISRRLNIVNMNTERCSKTIIRH